MIPLEDHQYEVDGVVFGLDMPMHVTEDGFAPGSAARHSQKSRLAGGDGQRFGKSGRGGMIWGFKMFSNAEDEAGAWAAVNELASVWPREELRKQSGIVTSLRYRLVDRTYRIFGRPERWDVAPNNLSLGGRIDVVADFESVDHLIYDDIENRVPVTIAPPLDPESGVIPPIIPPFTTTPRSGPRQGEIEIGGSEPTWITLTFDGPLAEGKVQVGGWTAALIDVVQPDDPVTIDPRPWVRSATKRSGGGVRLSPRVTQLSRMLLPPGRHEVVFTGIDSTASSSVTVSWRNARRTP